MDSILTLLLSLLPAVAVFIAITAFNVYVYLQMNKIQQDIKREQQEVENKLLNLQLLEESFPKKEVKKGLYNYPPSVN